MAILQKIRWAVLLLSVGSVLGFFGGCFYLHEASVPSAIATLLGVPMALLGLALKGSELAPVPIAFTATPPATIAALRTKKATPAQTQILTDVTRYQYGSSVHLETALEKLGIASPETDEHPALLSIREAAIDDSYALILEFTALDDVSLDDWQRQEAKMAKFFGPNVKVTIDAPTPKTIEVAIVAV
jgi:Protein of unknown function (DUF2854)